LNSHFALQYITTFGGEILQLYILCALKFFTATLSREFFYLLLLNLSKICGLFDLLGRYHGRLATLPLPGALMCEANAAYNEKVEEGKGEEGGHARQQQPVIYQEKIYYRQIQILGVILLV
jgi:hypothetical protein